MGLLDDAIREHLELKRAHGAPDDEIQRAEQEALGPARRDPAAEPTGAGVPPVDEVPGEDIEPEPAAIEDPPLPAVDEAPPVDDPVYAEQYEVEPAPADFDEDADLEEAPPPGTPKPHGDPELGDYPEPVVPPDEPTDDPAPNSPHGDVVPIEDEPDEVPREEQLGSPTADDDPHRARTSILDDPLAEGDEQQDVLEETPDFLQEAPEHDKLWFEQKPPRDFDFD
jgi:hypothetical protein